MNMHPRHRNPGNGYRSNSMGMGMGVGPTSRISPEGSMRGHGGFYSSEHRNNFNRGGFGRGKNFQPPPAPPPPPPPLPPPPRKVDIFMEAGRLAAEYLVAQGLLPPSALSAKWQNSGFKKGEFQEGDHLQIGSEGRTSALARLGNSVSDGGSRRGRFGVDEFGSNGRNHFKGKKKNGGGSHRGGYGSDWGRDYGRSGSFSDRHSRASSDMEGDEGSVSGQHDEPKISKDVGNNGLPQNSSPSELGPKSEDAVDSESKLDKGQLPDDDMSSKPSSSGAWKEGQKETNEVGEEPTKVPDKEMKDQDCANNEETEKHNSVSENLPVQIIVAEVEGEGDSSCKNGTDLLTLCKFAKVPTRIRSSLTSRGPKVDPLPNTQEGNTSGVGVQQGESQVLVENGSLDVSPGATLLDKTDYDNCIIPETSKAQSSQSAENLVDSHPEYGIELNKYVRSQSLPGRDFVHENEQESSRGPVGFRSSSFGVKERGEKRALEESDKLEEAKKPRQWLPYMAREADSCFHLSNLSDKKVSSQEENASPGEKVVITLDHESSAMNDSEFQKDGGECIDYVQEKQFFPNSFKICDLNLMEVCDAHENRDSDPIIDYPVVSGMKKEAAPVDVDLSMNNSNVSGENSRRTVDVKEIEVIDLENDSIQEDKAFNDAERKTETGFTPLEGFSNHTQNTSDIPGAQDGYGLMISELLENNYPNCSSVPEDLNPINNEIGLHNAEGTLADDDSIYMALGEIPLTFLSPWEQPTPQEYEKPF